MGYSALERMKEINQKKYADIEGEKGPAIPKCPKKDLNKYDLMTAVSSFLNNSCEDLRFRAENELNEDDDKAVYKGKSVDDEQIPYNMQMDIDRLCLVNAVDRFLKSGTAMDAFDVYFCYLEMFVGKYGKSRRMIELLSEFESNSSSLLMKHRDHYSHSVYVFLLGLAIYETSDRYRDAYKKIYGSYVSGGEKGLAHHFLQYWGLASLFHDIGYPFELPFEQIESYFEDRDKNEEHKDGKRKDYPFISYNNMDDYIKLGDNSGKINKNLFNNQLFSSELNDVWDILASGIAVRLTDKYVENFKDIYELITGSLDKNDKEYAHFEKSVAREFDLSNASLEDKQKFTKDYIKMILEGKVKFPNAFNYFMDHAVFSALVLTKELLSVDDDMTMINESCVDALTAIVLHNSLYKFSIADWKNFTGKDICVGKEFPMDIHPLAFMLMLCDELQCWDRTSYGRSSRTELHPMGCDFVFENNSIDACYLFDDAESHKIIDFWIAHDRYVQSDKADNVKKPKLKAYSTMVNDNEFLSDIKKIVDLRTLDLEVGTKVVKKENARKHTYLSSGKFLHLYNFATALNAQWSGDESPDKMNEKFDKLSLEYKLSNIAQAKKFAEHLEIIGCFFTDQPVDFEMVDSFSDKELVVLGEQEHKRWEEEKKSMYWMESGNMTELCRGSKAVREQTRMHYDFRTDFFELDDETKAKDTRPLNTMMEKLKEYDGLRIYRYRSDD